MIPVYLRSWLNGTQVGEDEFGTKYFEEKGFPWTRWEKFGQPRPKRRWALYAQDVEASQIPAAWHAWLHYTTSTIPDKDVLSKTYDWQKKHQPNLTGTQEAYRPKGSLMRGGKRSKEYEAWTPTSK